MTTGEATRPAQSLASDDRRARSRWIGLMKSEPAAFAGMAALLLLVTMAIAAPLLARYSPIEISMAARLQGPSWDHWFGTDQLGRDLFARVLYGARVSLSVSLLAVSAGALVGGTSGVVAGYYGGRFESLLMRFWDAMFAIPMILVAIAVVSITGTDLKGVGIAVAIGTSPFFARIARGAVVQERAYDYVEAIRGLGVSNLRVMVRHVLPNAMGPVVVQFALALSAAVLVEAALSYLGLGAQEPTPSWGAMLATSRRYLRLAPWYGVIPGVAVTYLVVAVNLCADGLRGLMDPRSQRRRSVLDVSMPESVLEEVDISSTTTKVG